MSRYGSELAERLDELALSSWYDDQVGDVDGIGWFARFDDELAILTVDSLGFVDAFEYGTLGELGEAWDSVEAADADFLAAQRYDGERF